MKVAQYGLRLWIALLLIFAQVNLVKAEMEVLGLSLPRHDRFYAEADKAFIARRYDLSGVSKVVGTTSRWATMVSNSFLFLQSFAPQHWRSSKVLSF